jgi:hypothetical protein
MSTAKSSAVAPVKLQDRLGRAMLLLLGMSSLIMGIWGGLLRVPVALPLPVSHANWISFHGPLMVCGFLGTLISLERAVGLRALWTYLVPLLTGTGAATVAAGVLDSWPRWMLTAGSAVFVVVSARILSMQPNLSNTVMAFGVVAWAGGNLLWTRGQEIPQVVLWWLTFLLLTITGERIELTRFQKPSPWSRPWLLVTLVVLSAGLASGWVSPRTAGVLVGLALCALAAWLTRFDFAWRTIRHPGLPRFMAICLLSGYAWLFATAVLVLVKWPQTSGLIYDATLHTFFVGFVFSMIFGHAPVIFPAVLGLPVQFRWTSYVPLAVLHGSLLMRLAGDLTGLSSGRVWGAAGNAVAVGLFLLNMVAGFVVPSNGKHSGSFPPVRGRTEPV